MKAEMGELLVGAYLTEIQACDFVLYNVRERGGKLKGLQEYDLLGIHKNRIYLCEVTTHLHGVQAKLIPSIVKKHKRQIAYSKANWKKFNPVFMFWAPSVPKAVERELRKKAPALVLIINNVYAEKVGELVCNAMKDRKPTGNAAYRLLQILAKVKG